MAVPEPDFQTLRQLVKKTPLGILPLDPVVSLLPRVQADWQVVNLNRYEFANDKPDLAQLNEVAVKCIDSAPNFSWKKLDKEDGGDSNTNESELDLPPLAKAVLQMLPDLENRRHENLVSQLPTDNVAVKMRWAAPREIAQSAAKLYETKAQRFLASGTIGHLVDLNRSLNHIEPHLINLDVAQQILDRSLQFLEGDLSMCLAVCETVLQFRLKRPDALELNSIKTINAAISAFKAIVLEIPSTLEAFVGVEWVMELWVRLIKDKSLDEQQCLPLLLAAYSVIFSANFHSKTIASKKYDGINVLEQARRKCADLVFACYSAFPEMRKDIVQDILTNLTKLGKWRRAFSISFAPGSGCIHVVVGLMLRMIQESGETPLSVWHHAADTKSKAALEKACQSAGREATNVCVMFAKYLIEACHTGAKSSPIRVLTQCLMEDMAATLPYAEWPASELFISCFVSVLFQASPLYMKQRSFMVFLLDMLKTVEGALFKIYKSTADITTAGTIIDQLVRQRKSNAANFLATMLCARPTKLVSYLECYARMTTESPPYVGYRRVPESQWYKVLRSRQIGNYYEQIMEVMLVITCSNDIPDRSQVEILKLLAQCIETNPQFFNRIREKLLAGIQYGPPALCDGSMLVVVRYIAATSIDDNESLILEATSRIPSPGLASYKKRCLRFLAEVFLQTELDSLRLTAWKSLLRASNDSEISVSKLGTELLQDLIFNDTLTKDRSKRLEALCAMISQSHASEPPYPWLLRRFLRLTLITLPSEKAKRETIRDIVDYLLSSIEGGGRPNFAALQAASVVLEANGFYVPSSKVAALFSLSCGSRENSAQRLVALRMLNAAVSAVPRMILSPRVVSRYFPLIISKLKLYSEPELEYVGPILWSLCKFGNVTDRKKRVTALDALSRNIIAKYWSLQGSESAVVVSQLLLLMTAAVRFWVDIDQVHQLRDTVLDIIVKLVKKEKGKLRLGAVVCLMKICTRYPDLFLEPIVDKLLHNEILLQPSSEEWSIFIVMLLEFLQNEEDRLEAETKTPKGVMSGNLLHSTAVTATVDSASAGLLQRYLEPILTRALASEDSFAATSTKLLVHAIESGRVDIHESLPAVIALTTAQSLEISKVAQRGYTFILGRWGSTVEQRLSEGIHMALDYHSRCNTGPIAPGQIAWLWEELAGSRQTMIQTGIHRLIQSLKECPIDYAICVIEGLSVARIEEKHIKVFAKNIEDVCYACDLSDPEYSGELIAVMIALYVLRLRLLESLDETITKTSKLDVGRIISRFSEDAENGRNVLEKLFDVDHLDPEIEDLLYGSKRRRLN